MHAIKIKNNYFVAISSSFTGLLVQRLTSFNQGNFDENAVGSFVISKVMFENQTDIY